MINKEAAARAFLEKNRLDPPPEGKEWCLGWTEDGHRVPANDRLVSIETKPADVSFGLHSGEGMLDGFEYQAAGPGTRADLVDAAMEALAELDPHYQANVSQRSPVDVEDAVLRTLSVTGRTEGGHLREVRNVVRLAVRAALVRLRENPNP